MSPQHVEEAEKRCGHLACQTDSWSLRCLRTTVCAAQLAATSPTAAAKKKSKTSDTDHSANVTFIDGYKYRVLLLDSVLFPEGGGQPPDYGWIADGAAIDSIQTPAGGAANDAVDDSSLRVKSSVGVVYNVQNENGSCALYVWTEEPVCNTWLQAGRSVHLYVDWARRFDHMQQHSGQHLISAFAERKFGADTGSWELKQWHTGVLLPVRWRVPAGGCGEGECPVGGCKDVTNNDTSAVTIEAAYSEDLRHLPFVLESGRSRKVCSSAVRNSNAATTSGTTSGAVLVEEVPLCFVDLCVGHMFTGDGGDPPADQWAVHIEKVLSVIGGMVECAIEADHKMHPEVVTLKEANARGVFGRELKTNELPEKLRLILIGREGEVDANLCCGTHVSTLGQLRAVALMSFEKFKSGTMCKVYFAVGRRLRAITEAMSRREDRLTAVMRVRPLLHCDEAARLIQSCAQLSGTKDKYRSYWLKCLVADACAKQEKLLVRLSPCASATGNVVDTTIAAARKDVRVVVVLVDDVVSSDEGKQITAEGIVALKQRLGLYELEKLTSSAPNAKSADNDEVADYILRLRARCFGLVGLLLVVPANVCNTGRGSFSVNPGHDGYWAIVGHESLVVNQMASVVTSALKSKGGGGRAGICQGKWCWPPAGEAKVKMADFAKACDDAGSNLQQMFLKGE
eukprot:Lankesteria_metandrocarpae@DN562_c0_g1_i2.p1